MLRKIIFAFLISNFLLFDCDPMSQLQTNLGQLKYSLGKIKTKLSSLQSKLGELNKNLNLAKIGTPGPVATKNIVIGGNSYGTCAFWNFSTLEKYVRTNNFEPFSSENASFNVIERGKLGNEETAFNTLVGDPQYNGAVFQVAANDDVSGMWQWGGVQAGYFVDATTLGEITRANDPDLINSFFVDIPLQGHISLRTKNKDPLDINNILIAVHSDLEVKDTLVKDKDKKQVIHASITAGYSGGRESASKTYGKTNGIKIAQNCLKAGYEGTLLAAVVLRAPKVVLTFLGCHVFANDPNDVFDAIAQAVRTYVKKYNLNVTAYLDDTTKFTKEIDDKFLALAKEINGCPVTKEINIDGKKYCTCEYWKVSVLEKYVKNNCKPFDGVKPVFNVIPRGRGNLAKIVKDQMTDSQYNGAVFQLAANDNVPYVWTGGGSHAGYMVKATELGNIIRNHGSYKDCKNLNTLFDDPALPKSNSSRTKGCAALGTADASPEDLNNIFIAIHSGLAVHGIPGQNVNVVFTAAYDSPQLPTDEIKMKNCLKAGYDGILLSAIKLGVSKIVLTIIGGHVFEGYPPYIIDAIENAIREYAVKYNLNITLYLDDSKFSWQGNTNLQEECDQRLINLAKEINGA